MLRLIALDLDGTLLHDDKSLSRRSSDILKKYASLGAYIVAASGRAVTSLPDYITDISDYLITSNGVSVYEKRTGKMLFHQSMRAECVLDILELIRKTGCCFELFSDGIPFASREYVDNPEAFGLAQRAVSYIRSTRTPVDDIMHFSVAHADNTDCIALICEDLRHKNMLLNALSDISGIYVTSSVSNLIEISDESSGKGAALERLADFLNISPQHIAAFGNAENDIDMMKYAFFGVAVANSPENVKAEADYVTLSNNEDGAAVFLERLLECDGMII